MKPFQELTTNHNLTKSQICKPFEKSQQHRKKKQSSTSTTSNTTHSSSSSKSKQPCQINPRKSYYFTRELNQTSNKIYNTSPEPPRKSSPKQKPKRRTPKASLSSPLDSSAESESPDPEIGTDRVLLPTNDIIIDVDNNSLVATRKDDKLKGYDSLSELMELPPIVTEPENFSYLLNYAKKKKHPLLLRHAHVTLYTSLLFFLILFTAAFISSLWSTLSTTNTNATTKTVANQTLVANVPKQTKTLLNCSRGNQTTCSRNYPTATSETEKNEATCPEYFRWIHEDLKTWKEKGISREALEMGKKTAHFRLVVKNGKGYVENYKESIQTRSVFTIWGILQSVRRERGSRSEGSEGIAAEEGEVKRREQTAGEG